MSILNTQVSWFKDYYTVEPGGTVSIIDWLQSKKLKQKVEAIRVMGTKGEKDAAKAKLPAITPSGIFNYRKTEGLIKHSGIICIDIDKTGNEDIANYDDLKKELCKIRQVAYCGTSVSGTGFFILILLAYPERHKEQFQALKQQFWQYGIVIDNKCGNIDRLRGASFDNEAYYNFSAIPFTGLPDKRRGLMKWCHQQPPSMIKGSLFEQAKFYTEVIHSNKLKPGGKHWYIYRMAEYLAANEVSQEDASEWIYDSVLSKEEINSNCISYPYQLQNNKTDRKGSPTTTVPVSSTITKLKHPENLPMQQSVLQPASIQTSGPEAPPTGTNYSLKRLQAIAAAQFSKSMCKDRDKYFAAWAQDREPMLLDAGITRTQFLEAIIHIK